MSPALLVPALAAAGSPGGVPGSYIVLLYVCARSVAFASVIALLLIAPSGCVSRGSVLPLAKA